MDLYHFHALPWVLSVWLIHPISTLPLQTATELVARSRSFSEAGPRKLADFDLGHKSVGVWCSNFDRFQRSPSPTKATALARPPNIADTLLFPVTSSTSEAISRWKDWIAYSLKPPVLQLPKMARFPKRQGRWCQRFALLRKSRRCCLPEFQTQAVTEACGTGLTHRAQRNWEGSMIDDFSRGWSHSCKPRRSCLLYLCFILRVQNNAASLIDFNMAAGGQQDCSRKSAASLKWIWRKANSCLAYTPLDVCARIKSGKSAFGPR